MSHETENADPAGASISLPIPPLDPGLFKHKATSDVLLFLTNYRFNEFSLRELANQVGHSHQSVRRAVNVLSSNELVVESRKATSDSFKSIGDGCLFHRIQSSGCRNRSINSPSKPR